MSALRPILCIALMAMGCTREGSTVTPTKEAAPPRVPDSVSTADEIGDATPESDDDEPVAVAPEGPPAPSTDRSTCTVRVQIMDAGAFRGVGVASDSDEASLRAWADACQAVMDATGIDCHDSTRVRVASIGASIRLQLTQDGMQNEHEQTIELVTFREGSGAGSGASHQEACRLAKEDACRAVTGQGCPRSGVRLIEVDGDPAYDEAWKPPQQNAPDRVTI